MKKRNLYLYVLTVLSPLVILSCSSSESTNPRTTTHQVSISASPSNGGTVSPESGKHEKGQEVDITATPADGWEFKNWDGDYTGTSPSATITIDGDKDINAIFEKKNNNLLALKIHTTGQGTVAKNPDQSTYEYSSMVELTAFPDNGWEFKEWQGDVTGTENPVQLTINEAKDITAVFVEQSKNLFYLADNGVTVKCPLAAVGDSGVVNGITYTKRSAKQMYINAGKVAATTCTSDMTDMSEMFYKARDFNADISSWDVSSVRDMSRMFDIAHNFNADLSSWDVSQVENMYKMFWEAHSFNGNISSWDVSNVKNMHEMFAHAIAFNGDISRWKVSSLINMGRMFYVAKAFNGDISSWDVSSVTNLRETFMEAEAFNSELNKWNVSNVTTMYQTFAEASAFNSDLNSWNVGNVTTMRATFSGAKSFNGDLSGWNVSKVGTMRSMFGGTEAFNRDISSWKVGNVTNMQNMFHKATAFNQSLNSWNVSQVTDMESMFNGAESFNGNISSWDVSHVRDMDLMFLNAIVFNQDLSGWCARFGRQPSGFSQNSGLILRPEHLPDWGTCP